MPLSRSAVRQPDVVAYDNTHWAKDDYPAKTNSELMAEIARLESSPTSALSSNISTEPDVTSSQRLSALLKALPAGVVVLDARGIVQECNPAAISLLDEPLKGERWVDVIARAFSPKADDGHEVSLKDGRRLSIQTCSLENGFGQLILLSDLTETRMLQSQLARHERLSAMGNMIASLAHQIRTPLSAALLYGEHLTASDISEELRLKCAHKLLSRLGHLEQQVRDMLLFARGDAPVVQHLECRELFTDIQLAAESLCPLHEVEFQWNPPKGTAYLVGNSDSLVSAVMNLINNSIDALKDQRNPTIRVGMTIREDMASISVTDNGAGFKTEFALKLMEAFYTTKPNGTGLGLAVVQSVAKSHHGRFYIVSPGEGKGTQAMINLPLLNLNTKKKPSNPTQPAFYQTAEKKEQF